MTEKLKRARAKTAATAPEAAGVHSGKLIVIAGPTATGKSDLSVELARWVEREFGIAAEIISADSRQVYRGMNIGTGKITVREMRGIPHHLLDVANPARKMWNASKFKREAMSAIKKIQARGHVPIVVGGTGYWIDGVALNREFPDVPMNPALRRKMAKETTAEMFAQLCVLNPERAATIDRHNPMRLIRAIEIAEHGKAQSELKRGNGNSQCPSFDVLYMVLNQPDEILRPRIAKRLDARLKRGMIAEVKKLHAAGVSAKRLHEFGLEYRYVSAYLAGMNSRDEMRELLAMAIWHYAKRQRTWFKRNKGAVWLDGTDLSAAASQAERLTKEFLKK